VTLGIPVMIHCGKISTGLGNVTVPISACRGGLEVCGLQLYAIGLVLSPS